MKFRIAFYILLLVNILFVSVSAQDKGKASYYAHRFQGKKTSSGIPYHKDSLTCAHRSLPFGTLLRVRNPINNKEVIVSVTDRGPRSKNRLIDLSYAAAKQLGIIRQGIAPIEISKWEFVPVVPLLSFDQQLFLPVKCAKDIYGELHLPQGSSDR